MLKSLLFGIGTAVIGLTVSLFLGKMDQGMQILGTIGVVWMLIAGIISGSFASGDRVRANYTTTFEEENKRRLSWSLNLMLLGLPSLVASLVYYARR